MYARGIIPVLSQYRRLQAGTSLEPTRTFTSVYMYCVFDLIDTRYKAFDIHINTGTMYNYKTNIKN